MHTSTIYHSFKKRTELPNEVEQALAVIRDAGRAGASPYEVQQLRLRLCETMISNLPASSEEAATAAQSNTEEAEAS